MKIESNMIILRIVGALYILSGLWCMARPLLAASFVGYELQGAVGKAEFFTVYGGLQLGLGLAMLIGSSVKQAFVGTMLMAFVVSLVLALVRLLSLLVYTDAIEQQGLAMMVAVECLLAFVLLAGWLKIRTR